jgi:hypothetical protein
MSDVASSLPGITVAGVGPATELMANKGAGQSVGRLWATIIARRVWVMTIIELRPWL